MDCPENPLRSVFPLFLLSILLALPLRVAAGDPWTVYDSDPQHPWNRVFRVLYDMTPPVAGNNPQARIESHWPHILLHGERHRQTLATLDTFLNSRAEKQIRDPVRRALFQNDLWKFFNWTLSGGTTDDQAARVAIQTRLVRIMRRVALTRAEIERLPDTYASSIHSRAHPAAHNPARRQKAFLPPDLWDEKGPWVVLGNNRQQRPAAIIHARQLGATSDFFVFLSLPSGREPTTRWLRQLRVLDYHQIEHDVTYLKRQGVLPSFIPVPTPIEDKKLEAWLLSVVQAGTRVALARQMRVLDTTGYDYPTRIIERVQIRVYRDPKLPPQFPPAPKGSQFQTTQPIGQDVFMFRLDRRALAAGHANSLRPVGVHEYTLHANFINGVPVPDEIRPVGSQPAPNASAQRVLDSCVMCHGPPGVFSFMTFSRAFMASDPVPRLHAYKREHEEGAGRHLHGRPLGYLQALWETVPD